MLVLGVQKFLKVVNYKVRKVSPFALHLHNGRAKPTLEVAGGWTSKARGWSVGFPIHKFQFRAFENVNKRKIVRGGAVCAGCKTFANNVPKPIEVITRQEEQFWSAWRLSTSSRGGIKLIIAVSARWQVWLFTPKGEDSIWKSCIASMELVRPKSMMERFLFAIW